MKRYLITVIKLLSLSVLFFSCEKREEIGITEVPVVAFVDSVVMVAFDAEYAELAYTVENPIDGAEVSASSEVEWIKNVAVLDEKVMITVSVNTETKERAALIELEYFYGNGSSVTATATVVQAGKEDVPAPIVYLDDIDSPIPAEGGDLEIGYTVENPVDGAEVSASSEAKWLGNLSAADGKLTLTVAANTETSTRTASVLLTYTYAEDMKVTAKTEITQDASTPAPVVAFTEESVAVSYEGGSAELAYSVENPVEGGYVRASSETDWIAGIAAVDGKVTFTVAANTETSSRTASVLLTYSYSDGQSVTDEAEVFQDARPVEIESGLYAARFTTANVATLTDNGADVTVTFTDRDMRSSADMPEAGLNTHTYFQYKYLRDDLGLFDTSGTPLKDITDASGRKYHLPSVAEITLLVPADVCPSFGMANTPYDDFSETGLSEVGIEDGTASKMKQGTNEVVYGIRFIGSDQAAAYRWEWHKTSTEDAYLSIKIKALDNQGVNASFDTVADEAYWTDAEIELDFPILGIAMEDGSFNLRGNNAFYWTSTPYISDNARSFIANVNVAGVGGAPMTMGHPLRLIADE